MRIEDNSFMADHVQTSSGSENVVKYKVLDFLSRSDITVTKRGSDGFRPPTPYKVSKRKIDISDSIITYPFKPGQGRGVFWKTNIVYPYQTLVPFGIAPSRKQQLKAKCLSEVKDQTINLAMTLAFLGQSADMVSSTALKIVAVLKAVRKRDWNTVIRLLGSRTPRHQLKTVADITLAVQFGWRQLIADFMGAAEALDKGLRKEDVLIYANSQMRDERFLPISHRRVHTTYIIGDFTCNVNVTDLHRCAMVFKVDMPRAALLSAIGLTNPLELAWDVIPWSFVVNWALPIGDWLSSIDASTGCTYKGGTYTRTSRAVGDGTMAGSKAWPKDSFNNGVGSGSVGIDFYEMNREVITDYVDEIYLKNPFDASLNRAITASALVVQIANKTR